jgi:hypothetical protein
MREIGHGVGTSQMRAHEGGYVARKQKGENRARIKHLKREKARRKGKQAN